MGRTIAAFFFSLLVAVTTDAGGLATPRAHSSQILIPAAISAAGANGTHFRSDIRITNQRHDSSQRVFLQWLPRDGGPVPAGDSAFVTIVDISPHETIASDDFVREVMNRGDLGAIVVQAIDESGEIDPDGRLHVTSRIWTPQPGTDGTSSQTLAPIPLTDVYGLQLAILGHKRSEQYRTNVGIVNLDATDSHTFRVTVSGENPTFAPEIHHVKVPPFAMVQFPIDGVPQEQLRIDIEEEVVQGDGRLTLWTAYASSVDNVTGDGWSSVGVDISE